VTTPTAAIGALAFGAVLWGYGAVLSAGVPAVRRGTPPAVIPLRVVELNPATGAVIWSSSALRTQVVLDPATGSTVPSPDEAARGRADGATSLGPRASRQGLPILHDHPTHAGRRLR